MGTSEKKNKTGNTNKTEMKEKTTTADAGRAGSRSRRNTNNSRKANTAADDGATNLEARLNKMEQQAESQTALLLQICEQMKLNKMGKTSAAAHTLGGGQP